MTVTEIDVAETIEEAAPENHRTETVIAVSFPNGVEALTKLGSNASKYFDSFECFDVF